MSRSLLIGLLSCLALAPFASAEDSPLGTMSLNPEIKVLPTPGKVVIDGKTDDWDLSAGILSYNTPQSKDTFSVWTHLMWDEKGVYFLARYADKSPMMNPTRGKDFGKSWTSDAYQARVILDDKTPDEHQMHINLFYSTPEKKPYLIVYHGGFGEATGPERPDMKERFGETMDKQGGQIAIQEWENGKGYNVEAFWPWSFLRVSGQPLKPGDEFVYGMEAMWGNPDGSGTWPLQRLADGVKSEKTNRIFMFMDRNGWGKATISDKGNLNVTKEQEALWAERLAAFENYNTAGSIPITYDLPDDREVTIAIDDASGKRVRNLFGQYPRRAGKVTDWWDGLDDKGNPVTPGKYTASVVDHRPFETKFLNSLYNAATPPWPTNTGKKLWGADHGHPATIATRKNVILAGFDGVESGAGLLRLKPDGLIEWMDRLEGLDATLDDQYVYTLGLRISGTERVIRRFNLETGAQMPFEDAAASVEVLLGDVKDAPLASTLAYSDGKLLAVIPGKDGADSKLIRMNAKTGAIENSGNGGKLLAITDREGALYGLFAGGEIATLKADGSRNKTVLKADGLKNPVRLAVSQDKKRFAISDAGTNQVFIFDPAGKLQQTLGKAYESSERAMRQAGDFIATDFARPMGLDFDEQGRLWIAEASRSSKRVTTWSPDGKLVQEFWGGADYGAMEGFPLVFDSTRFIAHGVEFKLDPNPDIMNRPTAEKALRFHPDLAETRGYIYQFNGHEYAVTTPGQNAQQNVLVAVRGKDDVFRACMELKYDPQGENGTAWVDRNGNGEREADEITTGVKGKTVYWSNGWIRPDLSLFTADGLIYPAKNFTASGIPLYDFANPTRPSNQIPESEGSSRGTAIIDDAGNISDGLAFHTVDGRSGAYPNPYGRHDAPAARRGLVIAAFRTNGVLENIPGVGSVTALGGDRGEWYLISMDGLYLSNLWQDIKGEVSLDETMIGSESFGGFIWRDEKGRVLAQLGGPSFRIMEILGLDTIRKQKLTLDVTAKEIEEGKAKVNLAKSQLPVEATELTIAKVAALPIQPVAANLAATSELIAGAPTISVSEPGNAARNFRAALAHDGTNLAIMFQVADPNPWKNGESRSAYGFIGGDAVDLKLDVPGRGPLRVLAAPINGADTVAFWQQTSASPENPFTYSVGNNLNNSQKFDVVKALADAKVAIQAGPEGYGALVIVPLKDLGLDAANLSELKGDIGVIFSDPSGKNRVSRLYWKDKNSGMVSDVPTESKLDVGAWGKAIFKN